MTKKRNTIAKLVLCVTLATIMVLSAALPAMASPAANYSSGSSSASPARAAITKILKMPLNTPVPTNATFVFKFEKTGMGEPLDSTDTAKAGMPAINNVTITMGGDNDPGISIFNNNGVKQAVKESANFLDGMIGTVWGNGVGIYKYTVYENLVIPNPSSIPGVDDEFAWAVYSGAIYDVEIWVDEDSGKTLFPKFAVMITKPGYIDEYYGTGGGLKVDPTPGGKNEYPDEITIEDDFSQAIFTNRYWKTDGGGPLDPDKSALTITKVVKGLGEDLGDDEFLFNVKVTQSTVIPQIQEYLAKIIDKNNADVTATRNPGLAQQGFIPFTSGTEKSGIMMIGGDKLVFVNLHIGSDVEVTEAATDTYIPSYTRTFPANAEFHGLAKSALGFPSSGDPGAHYTLAGANTNIVTFTNNRAGATPTGIGVDNLPYFAFLGVVLVSLAGYMVYKYRRNSKYDA